MPSGKSNPRAGDVGCAEPKWYQTVYMPSGTSFVNDDNPHGVSLLFDGV